MLEKSCEELEQIAKRTRHLILQTAFNAGYGHLGGSLSAVEILIALYFHSMDNIKPHEPTHLDRDRFILSKGHITLGLYSVLALRGYFPEQELLETFVKVNSRLQAHPDMQKLPCIDISSGSLGQGLSCGIGMALGAKLINKKFKTYVMMGCGELQEGQIWEAAMYAGDKKINNLIGIIDYNRVQLSDVAKNVLDVHPLKDKWQAFNWQVFEVDGHNIREIIAAIDQAKKSQEKPSIIIAHTVKGKGFSLAEGKSVWHSRVPNEEELILGLAELARGNNNDAN